MLRISRIPFRRPIARASFCAGLLLAASVSLLFMPSLKASPTQSSSDNQVVFDLPEAQALTPLERDAWLKAVRTSVAGSKPAAGLKIDYPFPGSVFPPDMVAPTFLFHDSADTAKFWLVDIALASEQGHTYIVTDGRRLKEEIDPRCVAANNAYQPPEYQATAKGWTPSSEVWKRLIRRPERDVVIAIYGLAQVDWAKPPREIPLVSQGTVDLRISKDPVGAPIFYRDVPLMPDVNEQGVIKPLSENLLPVIEWRLRDLTKPSAVAVLKNLPTCGNCHSFSSDGKFLGMDMDGPSGDKGSYGLAPIEKNMVIKKEQVFTWNNFNPRWETYGLFSRVSPDGRYVVSSVNEKVFVSNYMDFRFLQTFYPTRGILAVYNRETGKISTLPGADDPEYVHCNAVWTPDGKQIVFLRAKAVDSIKQGEQPVKANDPNEIQIQYDLYIIPFNEGAGGEARPLPGASGNGKSNSFPKISPDGGWIVWVQAANGLLMRPDSELYIMPLAGGKPRRMNCNLPLMNSWHSFSPNSRWLVFSSKSSSPFTQMFLTHIDEQGDDSPAIAVPNSTAANRAVNIPEFVNIPPASLASIDVPAVDYRRHLDRGIELIKAKELAKAYEEIKIADEMKPNFPETQAALGYYYREVGDIDKAISYFDKALSLDFRSWAAHNYYGVTLFRLGKYDEALSHFQAAIKIYPYNFQALTNSGVIEFTRGNLEKAKEYFELAIEANPQYAEAHFNLALIKAREGDYGQAISHYEKCLLITPNDADTTGNLAWIYATCPQDELRNGRRALEMAKRMQNLVPAPSPRLYDILAAAFAETGQFKEAAEMAQKAVDMTASDDLAAGMRQRLLELYKAGKPYHGQEL